LGQSGCGKTTLTRLINGLIPHFYDGELSGDVVIDGQLTAATPLDKLALHIGSVFQNPRSQFFNLDTTSEIAFGCENLGFPPEEIRRRVDSAAAELGISHLLDRDIFALSGGEKQLVALASSYALEPRILVLDEPSSNLDAQACTQLAAQLARLKASGKTIVIAEHRIHYLEDIYDRVLLIVDGRVADEWGSAEFSALSVAELEALGLRTRSLDGLVPRRPAAAASSAAPTLQPPAPAAAQPHPTPHPQPHPQPQSHSPTQSPRLQVYGLTAGYKHQAPIINKLSFHAAPGEIIAIIGANGQGKSTLARVLCGLHREWQGTVELDGKPLRPTQRPGLFYLVMQESSYQLFTDSVQNEMLLSSSRRHRPSAEKVQQILELLSLEDYRQRHPMSLSGGQKQRCAIGAAMAHDAEVLIFDEPTSGLDFANMCRVVEVLNQLSRQGKLLFIITHDYELLLRACTRALVLDGGRITRDLPIDASTVGLDGALGFSAASHTTHPSVDASTLPEIKAVLRKR
jgi:energy-coupling factor transport system ATP-binding protein